MVLIVFSVVLWLAEPAATTRPIIEQPDRQVTVDIPLPTLKQKEEILRLIDEGAEGVVLDIETGEVTEASKPL